MYAEKRETEREREGREGRESRKVFAIGDST